MIPMIMTLAGVITFLLSLFSVMMDMLPVIVGYFL